MLDRVEDGRTVASHPTIRPYLTRIERLEDENERLRAELRSARSTRPKELLEFPLSWRLTPQERSLLSIIVARDWVSREDALAAMRPVWGRLDMRSLKMIDVHLCRLRKKIAPMAVEIVSIWGKGFAMAPAHKARLKREAEANVVEAIGAR